MKKLILLFCACFLFFSCSDNETTSRLKVVLVDAPADYDAVNVEVLEVSVNFGAESDENAWQVLETQAGIYNLLELTAGNEVLLVNNEIPAGTISQVRLTLGENNSVMIGEDEFELKTPSGQSSGVKVSLHQEFIEGIDYTIVLDFDAARSIVDNPVRYSLKPVIRASLEALNGAIKGKIDPLESNTVIYLNEGEEIVTTTYPDEEGNFFFRGISEGMYTINVDVPDESLYSDYLIESVNVSIGEVTDLSVIELQSK